MPVAAVSPSLPVPAVFRKVVMSSGPCQRKRKHRMPREAHVRRLQGSSRPREHEDRRKRFRPRRHSRADIPASGVPGRMAAGVLSLLSLFLPSPWTALVFIASTAAAAVASLLYSQREGRKERGVS